MAIPSNIVELFSQIEESEHKFDKYHAYRAVEQLFDGHLPAKDRAITYLKKIGVYSDHSFYLAESDDIIDDLIEIHKIAKEANIPFEKLKDEYVTHLHKYGSKEDALKHIGKFVIKHKYLKESKDEYLEKLNSIDDSTINKLVDKIKTITDVMKHYKPEEFSYHINENKEEVLLGHIKKILRKSSTRVKLKKKSKPSSIFHKAKTIAKHLISAHIFHKEEHVSPEVEHAIVKSHAYKKLVAKLSPKLARIESEAVHEHHPIHEEMEPLEEPTEAIASSLPLEKTPYRHITDTDKKTAIIFTGQGTGKKETTPSGRVTYVVGDITNDKSIEKDEKENENE